MTDDSPAPAIRRRTPAEKLRHCAELLLKPKADKVLRAGVAITLGQVADELEQASATCDASTVTPGLGKVGPCILRYQHDGPVHRDRDGGEWWSSEVAEPRGHLYPVGGLKSDGSTHIYFSTGCRHGDMVLPDGRTGHEYCQGETGAVGAKTPAQCKFCAAPCRCDCHQTPVPAPVAGVATSEERSC